MALQRLLRLGVLAGGLLGKAARLGTQGPRPQRLGVIELFFPRDIVQTLDFSDEHGQAGAPGMVIYLAVGVLLGMSYGGCSSANRRTSFSGWMGGCSPA